MPERLRILHVVASLAPQYGGPSVATLQLASTLVRHGHDVTIATTTAGSDSPKALRDGIDPRVSIFETPALPPVRLGFSPGFGPALAARMGDYDVLHIHGVYSYPAMVAARQAAKLRIPYIIRPHGSLDPFLQRRRRLPKQLYHRFVLGAVMDRAAAIHFTTSAEQSLASWLGSNATSFVLPHGIDLDGFSALPARGTFRDKLPQLQNKKLILYLGRLNFKKGLDVLVQGFALLGPKDYGAHLVIAGPDTEHYGKNVRRWVDAYGLSEQVTFVDMLLGDDKLAAINDSDMFVLPSYSENMGVAILEAMACGRPVIISDQVNICDEVASHQAGVVVSCTAKGVADGLRTLLTDEQSRDRLGHNGRDLVRRKYSWDSITDQLEAIYRNLLGRPSCEP